MADLRLKLDPAYHPNEDIREEDVKAQFLQQFEMLQIIGCLSGILVRYIDGTDPKDAVITVPTTMDATILMRVVKAFDDTLPCGDAWFHIHSLHYDGESIDLPIKMNICWDKVVR